MTDRRAPVPKKGRLPIWRRLSWRLSASFVLITAAGILLSGFLQYQVQEQDLRASLGSQLVNIARTGALQIDPSLHHEVETTLTQSSDAFRQLRATLATIQDENQIETPIYTLTGFDAARQEAHFMVTSRGGGLPGEVYPLAPEILEPLGRAFDEGIATYTPIFRDRAGVWMSAYAPIRDSNGQTVAVLDVDYRVGVYLNQLAEIRRRLYLSSLAGALVALVAGLWIARRITQPVEKLSALARSVVEGDLSANVHVAARDEIGMLGNVFHLMVERVRVSQQSLVDVLVAALEARAGGVRSSRTVAQAAMVLADPLELSDAQRESLYLGALLHDVGSIRIPEALLQKQGRLTPQERRIVEQHPVWGTEILEAVPLLTPALDIVGAHHECYDGSGYPQGLRAEEIPLTARIFALVDALADMTLGAPDAPARPLSQSLESLRGHSGKQFDPRVVEAALSIPEQEWARRLGL
jgi:HAMP domain-containing protein